MSNIFDSVKKVHLIGIGGIGMSGIAEYLARKMYEVSGSDMTLSPVTERLGKFDIKIYEGHNENNLSEDCEVVIYSSAVKDDNPELQKAKRLNKKIVKRAEALGSIVNDKFVIAVSGTHGKTTTTAMIAKILIESKLDPTVFVGGNIDFLEGSSSRIGQSKLAVVEADEYDRSFLQLNSNIIVITNIDEDHLDIYKDIEDIKDNFRKFIQNGKPGLKIIACGDDKNVLETVKEFENKKLYGFKKNNDYIIENTGYGKKSITYSIGGDDIRIKVLGDHNILNSAASYIVAEHFNIEDEKLNTSLETFYGVKRRLELKYDNGIKIYDDYAHHPAEVKASLDAVKRTNPGRMITVFQPHLYSRTRDFHKEFEAFSGTDILILAKIYPAREKEIKGVSSEMILKEYRNSVTGHGKDSGGSNGISKEKNQNGKYIENRDKILDELEKIIVDGDVVIFQGAGDITDLCSKFVKRVRSKQNRTVPL
ncbi:MAG: UDP-N-acetylmuramate--L-alanine ligase [Ignavibacteria bacterium]|nr:UDP-N-acetylmuramate--L-alanine ligase [Ignavibacteria bacterium]